MLAAGAVVCAALALSLEAIVLVADAEAAVAEAVPSRGAALFGSADDSASPPLAAELSSTATVDES